ncbi:MAG: preprotein translocase subunit YajC [Geothrix sp.]|jgi:preprotein translocase subunit YajC|uniref:Sec translocon accessory complex subunit YajC n=1 Tax=Candidatus Geothrix odensensis TaxID=2954440 RepID=A0A936K7A4_9BACT|nr:preprotein translocase subunit YajC [Holophagaceae bacterium]MBK8573951.1 preprotein translocase subunit YajC [Candidatus Geothrix odensensis]MBK8789251.1 preprotein translocase subunit YajC [Holophagaceae bacterium]MBP7617313.1 preprotein translocase subunit YajC [Geothrix sp.]MCC6513461.1 preprotein translocase subunit YajC [Geothrix sp.]
MTFALLQQAAAGGAPGWTQFVFIGGMALMFYFLLIRPQSKARKEMEARLAKLKAGDEVVLSSGLYATIDRVEDKDLYVKLGNTVVKARRTAVAALASEAEPKQN